MKYSKQDEIELFQKFSENHKKRLEEEREKNAKSKLRLKVLLAISLIVNAALLNHIFW